MKKLLFVCFLLIGLASAKADLISTNLATTANTNTFLLLADRASVYSVELTATVPCLVKLYDNATLAAPGNGTNYVTAEYIGRSSYATNVATTYVGANGLTNWYTNSYVFTYSVTNAAATNALTPSASFVVAAGTYAVYNTDALFTRGIVAWSSTNCSIVVNYRSGR